MSDILHDTQRVKLLRMHLISNVHTYKSYKVVNVTYRLCRTGSYVPAVCPELRYAIYALLLEKRLKHHIPSMPSYAH